MKLKKNTKRNIITELAKVYVVSEEVIISVMIELAPKEFPNVEPDNSNLSKYAAKAQEKPMFSSDLLDLADTETKERLSKAISNIAKGNSKKFVMFLFCNNIPFESFDSRMMEIINEHRKEEIEFSRIFSELLKRDKFKAIIITN